MNIAIAERALTTRLNDQEQAALDKEAEVTEMADALLRNFKITEETLKESLGQQSLGLLAVLMNKPGVGADEIVAELRDIVHTYANNWSEIAAQRAYERGSL